MDVLQARITRRDPDLRYQTLAYNLLSKARALRETRKQLIAAATDQHGWIGPMTSGCEQTHWPEDIKDALRANAHGIGECIDRAFANWKQSGRRVETFRTLAATFRIPEVRY